MTTETDPPPRRARSHCGFGMVPPPAPAWTVEDLQALPAGGYSALLHGPSDLAVDLRLDVTGRETAEPYARRLLEVTWRPVAAWALDRDGEPCAEWLISDGWLDEIGEGVTSALLPVEQLALEADDCWDEDDSRRHGGVR